jgi:hypothetical protein
LDTVPVGTILDATTLIGLGGVPVIIAIVELVKRTAAPSDRWLPLFAVAVGVLVNVFAANVASSPLAASAFVGIVAGLAACGLYDARKVAG